MRWRKTKIAWQPIKINHIDELKNEEPIILDRIRKTPRGSILYIMNPFMLLEDIEVHLSLEVKTELRNHCPRLNYLDSSHYNGLRNLRTMEGIHIEVRHLFGVDLWEKTA